MMSASSSLKSIGEKGPRVQKLEETVLGDAELEGDLKEKLAILIANILLPMTIIFTCEVCAA